MDNSKHFTTKEIIRRADEKVAWYKKSVGRYQEIARGGKDGLKSALQLFKDSRDVAKRLKDDVLARPGLGRFMRGSVYAAEERTYDFVIGIFENPKNNIEKWERELQSAQAELNELRKFPTRD